MGIRCDFVDPIHNFPCGKNTTLAKIAIHIPGEKIPIIKFVCKIHGDARFNYLSMQEISLNKRKDQNKISNWKEYQDEIKKIRWSRCRRCLGDFTKEDIQCCLEFMTISDSSVKLRRSFVLHKDCLESELLLFNLQEDDKNKFIKLDSF